MLLLSHIKEMVDSRPHAYVNIEGEGIKGIANFYQTNIGVIVFVEVKGLPQTNPSNIFAFHIHEGESCTGDMSDPFKNALMHYNPANNPHPSHAGDLPPLFSNDGYAFSIFLTNRFLVKEIVGKTLIIHDQPDDFTTQPSGNAGDKIACGVIKN